MRPKLMILAAMTAAFVATAGVAKAADVVLRLGDDVAPGSVQAQALELFAAEVAERDVGIEVKVFHSSQLGTGAQQIQNVKVGLQEMVNTGYGLLDVFSDDLKLAATPFTFNSFDHFENWLKSESFDRAHQEIIAKGNQRIINLGVLWRRGPFNVMLATQPVLSLDDLAKVKLRIAESEVAKRYWGTDGLGATVIVLPLSDVYLSLRQGLVDAIIMPFDLLQPMKFGEVAKELMLLQDVQQFLPIMMNEEKWQSLTDEQRTALTESADVAGMFYNEQIAANLETWKADLVALGVTTHEIDRAPFIERVRQLNKQWESEGYWRPGVIDEINSYAN